MKAIYHKDEEGHRVVQFGSAFFYQRFAQHADIPAIWCQVGRAKISRDEAVALMVQHVGRPAR